MVTEKQHVISVDPGEVNIGFTYFVYRPDIKAANTVIMDKLSPKEFSQRLLVVWHMMQNDNFKPKNAHFVGENFRVDTMVRGAKFQWNEMKTIRQLGKLEFVAESLGGEVAYQEPKDVLPMARKWGPWSKLPQHIPDDKSAWLHGAHYMMKTMKWFPTIDSITMFGQEML